MMTANMKRSRGLKIPGLGRVIFSRDPGEGRLRLRDALSTNVSAIHRDGDGKIIQEYDLGSGLVTNVGVLALANDFAWSAQLNLSTLGTQNFHCVGTGTTAAAATDIKLQTYASPTVATGLTGVQSLVSAANLQIYKTVATANFIGSAAITEWGLFSLATISSSLGNPFTATTATSWQDTGSVLTASSATVRGLQQTITTPASTIVWGLNLSNTTHVAQIPAWYKVSDGTVGSTPGGTEAYTTLPVMFDHKVFSAINVVNGDSCQFTYNLTIQSGG